MRIILSLGFVAWAATASAQTVQTIDLNALGWGVMLAMPQAVETDGDPTSQEWLIPQVWAPSLKRILKVRPNGVMCAGEWFTADYSWSLQLVNGVHVYTQMRWPIFSVIHLRPLTPSC